ncbi:MAG: NADH:flavin oxidoreductase [Chloroflexi bacterium]|nr:NADH:flavin oxidoreductase [Chloroflexota bacterium]
MSIDLFSPYRIHGLELRNRFMRSATFDGTADSAGVVTEDSLAIYRELGRGGIGLIVSGFAFVSETGQAGVGQYGVHRDDMIPGLRRLAQEVHQEGGKIALQIVHAGVNMHANFLKQKGITARAVSPLPELDRPHREMTEEDIEAIISDFVSASVRAAEAGLDAVQFHGAHGYLISQFLSPLFNQRTDKWGGGAENRRRFLVEVVRRTRQKLVSDFPLLIKLGVMDDREGGTSLQEGLETARQIMDAGIDGIEVSTGVGTAPGAMKEGDPERAYLRERAAAVKRIATVPVMMVGGIRSLALAQDIVNSGDADMISMSRPFIREPGLLMRWYTEDRRPAICVSCSRCLRRTGPFGCEQERRLAQLA